MSGVSDFQGRFPSTTSNPRSAPVNTVGNASSQWKKRCSSRTEATSSRVSAGMSSGLLRSRRMVSVVIGGTPPLLGVKNAAHQASRAQRSAVSSSEVCTSRNSAPLASTSRAVVSGSYHGTVSLSPIAVERRLTILFPTRPSRGNPVVMPDGPTTSRHRFRWARPTSLCLWYPGDHEQLRWTLPDGLVGLVDLSRLHLIKEIYWRVHDAWPGLEVHRDPAMSSAPPRKRQLATRRQRCWAGRAATPLATERSGPKPSLQNTARWEPSPGR